MRTLLTMLGIVIGVGAVIVMVAVGNGAQTMIQKQISSLGTNLIIVMPGSGHDRRRESGRRHVQQAHGRRRGQAQARRYAALRRVARRLDASAGDRRQGNWRTTINGVSTGLSDDSRLGGGSPARSFSDADVTSGRKVARDRRDGGDEPLSRCRIRSARRSRSATCRSPCRRAGGEGTERRRPGSGRRDLVPYTTAQNRLSGNVRIGQILASATNADDIGPGAGRESRDSCARRTS